MADSPRVFASTNPWKITATFQTVSSTRDEYLTVIEELKATAPGALRKGEKRTRLEQAHVALIGVLEGRIEAIDAELAVSHSPSSSACQKIYIHSATPDTTDTNFFVSVEPLDLEQLTHLFFYHH